MVNNIGFDTKVTVHIVIAIGISTSFPVVLIQFFATRFHVVLAIAAASFVFPIAASTTIHQFAFAFITIVVVAESVTVESRINYYFARLMMSNLPSKWSDSNFMPRLIFTHQQWVLFHFVLLIRLASLEDQLFIQLCDYLRKALLIL